MLNLTNIPDSEAREIAKSYGQIKKIPVRGPASNTIHFAAEKVNYELLYAIQRFSRMTKRISQKIDDIIEDKIGEEADIPDFSNPYPIEQIVVLAVAYPFTKKPTIMGIAEHYQISKRQAIRVKNEIEHGFPSFPTAKKIWEAFEEDSRGK